MYFVKRDGRILPADQEAIEAFNLIEEGTPFKASPKLPRNLKQNNLFHAVCKLVADNHETLDTLEKVKTALKVATGLVDTYIGYNGKTYLVPRSVAFDLMSQTEFNRFMKNAFHVITTRFLPGVEDPELWRHLDELMHGPPPERPHS